MAGNGDISEKSRMGMPLFMAMTVFISAITGTAAAVASAYGFKEATIDRIEQKISDQAAKLQSQQSEALTHYLSLERFSEWRQAERARADQQYWSILNSIDRLRVSVESGRH